MARPPPQKATGEETARIVEICLCSFISVLSLALESAAFSQPPAIPVPMDWASCEQEVVRLYVDGAKTIRETLEYLNEKYGITVTQVYNDHYQTGYR